MKPQGRDLRIGMLALHNGFDPYHVPLGDVAELPWLFADGLVGSDAAGIVPRLAERVETTGSLVTYHVRTDARWHDGKPFVASDVVDAHKRLLASNPAWHNTVPYAHVADLDAPDARRVRVRLHKPDPFFARLYFAAYGALPIPLLRGSGRDLIGTGPFKIKETSAARTSLERVQRGGSFDRITVMNYGDSAPLALAVRTGEADFAVPMDRRVGRASHLRMIPRQYGVVFILANTRGALSDSRTREAVLGAIDVETIAKRVFRESSTDVVLPGMRLRPEKAGRLPSLPPLRILYAKSPALEEIALLAADSLQHHGAATSLHGVTIAQYEPMMRSGDFDLTINSSAYTVPGDLAGEWSCATVAPAGSNYARLCDPKLDAAFADGNTAEIAKRFDDDAGMRTIASYSMYAAASARLHVPEIGPFTPWFANVAEWKLG